jgi:hypothetical protein
MIVSAVAQGGVEGKAPAVVIGVVVGTKDELFMPSSES